MIRLCVSIGVPSTGEALAHAREAMLADLVEYRLDHFRELDLPRLMAETRKPIVLACPRKDEGGLYEGTPEQRGKLLFRGAQLGATAVDIPAAAAGTLPDLPPGCQRLVSWHDFEGTPPDLAAVEGRLRPLGDVVKIVTTAKTLADNFASLRLLEQAKAPTISFAMGEKGRLSRALAPIFGASWSYCSPASGLETACGQWTAEELRALYPPGAGRGTGVFGVVGMPVAQSLSPLLHGTGFRISQLDAVYLPFPAEDFREFAQSVTSPRFRGFSVTHPYKEAALALADRADPHIRAMGAANTWVRDAQGGWLAKNTDGEAAVALLEKRLGKLRNRLVAILGAGGAARAIAFEARREKAEVLLVGRDAEKAAKIAANLGVKSRPWGDLSQLPYDALIQATPVGMDPQAGISPIPGEWIRPGSLAMEIIYRPSCTEFLRLARARGAQTIEGREMFLEQAIRQFRLFTNLDAPEPVFRAVLERAGGG